jgi:hypothetical protein
MERLQVFFSGLCIGLSVGLFVGVVGLPMWFGL